MRSPRRSRASWVALFGLLAVLASVVAACRDDGGGSSSGNGSSKGGSGQLGAARVKLTPIARVDGPTAFAIRQGDRALYVTEQVGRVRAVRDGNLDAQPVLDLTADVGSGGERGLLGIAFSPDGSKMYLDYTNKDGDTRIVEYTTRGGAVDAASRRELLAVAQPQPNHNGGQLGFGPDGMLYIGLGDGGAAGDQGSGDAGQNQWEEIDFVAGGKAASLNFGWNRLEGTHQFSGQAPANAVAPIYEYSHADGGCSVSGGYVYRGTKIPDLRGAYVFTDYC